MTIERVHHSGALVVTELVDHPASYGAFFHSETFYGYSESEARELYAESLRRLNLTLVDEREG